MTATKTRRTETVTCSRCGGAGEFKEYAGIWGGTCFKCCGAGTVQVPYRSPEAKAKAAAKKAEKDAARLAKADANRAISQARDERIMVRYTGDPRLRVGPEHAWFHAHCAELARLDGVYDSI
jgi:DnaJ-class molecular chaperone